MLSEVDPDGRVGLHTKRRCPCTLPTQNARNAGNQATDLEHFVIFDKQDMRDHMTKKKAQNPCASLTLHKLSAKPLHYPHEALFVQTIKRMVRRSANVSQRIQRT